MTFQEVARLFVHPSHTLGCKRVKNTRKHYVEDDNTKYNKADYGAQQYRKTSPQKRVLTNAIGYFL